jgi:DNA-3-methyladenine glycosylase I
MERCDLCTNDPVYIKYHDEEWGVPVHDDKKLFEFLILEGPQAGISWITILKRREGYKKAFAHFDVEKVVRFSGKKIQSILIKGSGRSSAIN